MDRECCTCSSTTTRNAQNFEWKHFTIELQPAARFPSRQVSCVITLCHVRAEQHIQKKLLAIRVCCYSFLVMCGARFFRPELSKPLIGSSEICFGLPPNFSEESVKEANDLLVDAIVWGLFDSLFKNLTHKVLVLPQS